MGLLLIYVSKEACFQGWLMGGMYFFFGGAGLVGRSKVLEATWRSGSNSST
jgi:hypothetical protein